MSAGMEDQQLRRYLLGQLAPEAREQVVERLTRDEQYFDEAEAMEAELRDAFVRGELTGRDCDDFKRNLLRTARQREETAVARHLAEALDHPPARVPPTRVAPARVAAAPPRVWLSAAAGIGALAIILWQGSENRELRRDLEAARRPDLPIPSAPPSAAPGVASLFLPGVVVRGTEAVPELVLNTGVQLVQLEADRELPGAVQAELERAPGTRVWTQSLPAAAGSPVRIWMPAEVLEGGSYTLRLRASEPAREVAYRFRVTRGGGQKPSTKKPAQ